LKKQKWIFDLSQNCTSALQALEPKTLEMQTTPPVSDGTSTTEPAKTCLLALFKIVAVKPERKSALVGALGKFSRNFTREVVA